MDINDVELTLLPSYINQKVISAGDGDDPAHPQRPPRASKDDSGMQATTLRAFVTVLCVSRGCIEIVRLRRLLISYMFAVSPSNQYCPFSHALVILSILAESEVRP